MNETPNDESPIDAVITWVDGSDPAHRRKREMVLAGKQDCSEVPIAAGRDETRFTDNGELRYCLASIRKFTPWIRQIYLVTDDQVPDFLTPKLMREYRLRIIDHGEIFSSYEWALPTFNSRTIETALWRIKDLADRFIYFNDDFLLVNGLQPEDFFREDKLVLRGKWQPIKHYTKPRITLNLLLNFVAKLLFNRTRTMNLPAQMRAAQLAGLTKDYYQSPHTPRPVIKRTLAEYYTKNPDVFAGNIKHKFRDMNQHLAISLADHLEIVRGNAILNGCDTSAIIRGEQDSEARIRRTLDQIKRGEQDFLCLGSLEKLDERVRSEIYLTLDNMLA